MGLKEKTSGNERFFPEENNSQQENLSQLPRILLVDNDSFIRTLLAFQIEKRSGQEVVVNDVGSINEAFVMLELSMRRKSGSKQSSPFYGHIIISIFDGDYGLDEYERFLKFAQKLSIPVTLFLLDSDEDLINLAVKYKARVVYKGGIDIPTLAQFQINF